MKWMMAVLWVVAFAMRTSGQEVQKPVALTWSYDAQQRTLTLHLANYSHKDITAYNISIAESLRRRAGARKTSVFGTDSAAQLTGCSCTTARLGIR